MKRKPARPKTPAYNRFRIFLVLYVALVFLSNVVIGSVPGVLYHCILAASVWALMLCWINRRGKLLRYAKDFAKQSGWRLPAAISIASILWLLRPHPQGSDHFFTQYLLNAIYVIELNVVPLSIAFALFVWFVHYISYPYRYHPRLRMIFKSKAFADIIMLSLLLVMLCRALALFIDRFTETIFVFAHNNPYEAGAAFIGILMGIIVLISALRYLSQTLSNIPK